MAKTPGSGGRRKAGPTEKSLAAGAEPGQEEAAPAGGAHASAPDTPEASGFAATTASVTTADLNRNLGAVLGHVSTGGTVTLTRYGQAIAYITPVITGDFELDQEVVRQALPTIAASPQLRPAHQVDPQQAQKRRDALLAKINTSKRRG